MRSHDARTTAFNLVVNLLVAQLAVTNIAREMLHILATGYATIRNPNRHNVSEGDHKLNHGYMQVATESLAMCEWVILDWTGTF